MNFTLKYEYIDSLLYFKIFTFIYFISFKFDTLIIMPKNNVYIGSQ